MIFPCEFYTASEPVSHGLLLSYWQMIGAALKKHINSFGHLEKNRNELTKDNSTDLLWVQRVG